MRLLTWFAAIALLVLGHAAPAAAADPQGGHVVTYPRALSDTDVREAFYREVLAQALNRTVAAYGPAELRDARVAMSRARLVEELERGETVNVAALPTSTDYESKFWTIRIPIDRGLLGYRVSLIRGADQPRFAAVRTLDDLKALRAGLGADWAITKVFEANGLPVEKSGGYEALFGMLAAGRFDYFSRGVTEIMPEYQGRRAAMPELAIEQTQLIYAPLPIYFFVTKGQQSLAARLHTGLEGMVEDGSLDRMVRQHFAEAIGTLKLSQRNVVRIDNPHLPPGVPLARKELWFDPTR